MKYVLADLVLNTNVKVSTDAIVSLMYCKEVLDTGEGLEGNHT